MLIRRLILSVVRWSIWPLRWSIGEDTHRVQTGGRWEYLWYTSFTHAYTHTGSFLCIHAYVKRIDYIASVLLCACSLRC